MEKKAKVVLSIGKDMVNFWDSPSLILFIIKGCSRTTGDNYAKKYNTKKFHFIKIMLDLSSHLWSSFNTSHFLPSTSGMEEKDVNFWESFWYSKGVFWGFGYFLLSVGTALNQVYRAVKRLYWKIEINGESVVTFLSYLFMTNNIQLLKWGQN